jgi:phosphate transport system substrate-binding protein
MARIYEGRTVRMTHVRVAGAALVVAALAVPAVSFGSNVGVRAAAKKPKVTVITMSGSTSVAPLAAKLAKRYLKQFPRTVKFKLAQGGSDVGVADVAKGRVTIGNSSRDPKPSDPPGLNFNKIARDAICVVTNPGNAVGDLSQSAVQDIFSGKVRDWGDVSGARATGPINIVVRTPASGTQDAFQKLFMGTAKIADSAAQKASNGLVQEAVKSDKQAIGYVSLDFARGLNAATFKGTACTLRDAKSGAYEGTRNLWMVTRGTPTGPAKRFISWIQSNANAAKVISTEWVPLQ